MDFGKYGKLFLSEVAAENYAGDLRNPQILEAELSRLTGLRKLKEG